MVEQPNDPAGQAIAGFVAAVAGLHEAYGAGHSRELAANSGILAEEINRAWALVTHLCLQGKEQFPEAAE